MKKKFVVVAVLGTLVIGGVAGLYATTGDQREQAAKLEQNREDARNAGLPITVYELFPAETIDQEQNSAPLIIEASTLLDTDPETALEILLAIKDKSSCDFDHQVALDSDFVGSLRITDAVELLMSSASKNLENEEFDDFSAKVTAAEKIASHVASIPKPDALYASAMAERELLTTFGRLLHEYPKHKQLIQLSQEVGEKTRPLGVLKRSLRYGVVSGIETVSSMRQATLPGRLQSSYPVDPWGHAAVESKHLEAWAGLYNQLDQANSWHEAAQIIDEKTTLWSQDSSSSSYSLRSTDPDYAEAALLCAENVALRRMLFVASAAFDYYRVHNQFSAKPPVMGSMSQDPFRDAPLAYNTLGLGFSLYSWGYDGLDSGGTTDPGFTFENGDIGYRFSPSASLGDPAS